MAISERAAQLKAAGPADDQLRRRGTRLPDPGRISSKRRSLRPANRAITTTRPTPGSPSFGKR